MRRLLLYPLTALLAFTTGIALNFICQSLAPLPEVPAQEINHCNGCLEDFSAGLCKLHALPLQRRRFTIGVLPTDPVKKLWYVSEIRRMQSILPHAGLIVREDWSDSKQVEHEEETYLCPICRKIYIDNAPDVEW
ncbi:MAG TPA: hypothetical protein VF507_09155 [Pyrinomonadaceae bacterium]|jgi:hypothetical protein